MERTIIMGKIRNAKIKLEEKYKCYQRRKNIKYRDFSIISNNCWGGLIYQYFGLKYLSPTVGLFIMESDYVKMLSDLKTYMNEKLIFIDPKESKFYDQITQDREINYPVAKLKDIDVFFMHYASKKEAYEKWERRKKRINYDRLLVKLSERTDSSPDIIKTFSQLPFKNKICFTEKEYSYPNCVLIEQLKKMNIEGGDETPYTMEKIDICELINNL